MVLVEAKNGVEHFLVLVPSPARWMLLLLLLLVKRQKGGGAERQGGQREALAWEL